MSSFVTAYLPLIAIPALLLLIMIVIYAIMTAKHPPNINIYETEKVFKDPNNSGKTLPFPSLGENSSIELSVIVPAYNEESRLPIMLRETIDVLADKMKSQPTYTYEIIIVDDGSKDNTTEVALNYGKEISTENCRVLTLAKNLGKGGAVRRGALVARGSKVLFADADGATKFSDIWKMEEKLRNIKNSDNHGLVCGSRAHLEKESIAQRSFFRTILMKGFHICVWLFGCKTIQDTQCGFKLMTRETARVAFNSLHIERWAFDVELIKIAEILKIPTAEVSVNWTEIDGSKLDPISASIQMFKDLFFLWLRYFVGVWRIVEKVE